MEKIIQITAGKGPAECQAVVAKVLKLFLAEARSNGFLCLVLDREPGVMNGTLKSATLQLEGANAADFMQNWRGTIQWIGQSEFRKKHRRKNWFIGLFELDLSHTTFSTREKDFKYETLRSGGPGGQHVNKVSTAVRATHLPSGISVLASEGRSQVFNKKMAKARLINLLKAKQLLEKRKAAKKQWRNHLELERGNPVRVFRGSDFKSEFVSKSYKSQRQKAKLDLKYTVL